MSNPSSKFNVRAARPQTIGGVMGGFMRMFGPRASDADLIARWDEIMGADIASVARLAALRRAPDKKFNVAVRAANPAFALQLSYQTDEIRRRINKYFGYDAVAKITIRK
ncbi:MAG: DUF721 domain-containing protein [Alphaproteobacteria bacterium]|nr:DUF721 domain-containing protein [Alphaproteobacteria bacterium]